MIDIDFIFNHNFHNIDLTFNDKQTLVLMNEYKSQNESDEIIYEVNVEMSV